MASKQTQIVVVGGGIAGLLAARRLAWKTRRSEVTITLVNGIENHVLRPGLHQLAANQQIPQFSLPRNLRGTGVSFVQGWVTAIHPAEHTVALQTQSGLQSIGYDYLVYALGSTVDRDSVPGVREHAYALTPSGEKSAEALRGVLPKLNETGGKVLVVGSGATGIEAAAEFADSYPNLHIHLVTRGKFAAFTRQELAAYMEQSLRRRGITIQEQTTIAEVQDNAALTSTGQTIPFDLCLWAGGFKALPLARETGIAVNERGQILVDPYLRSISHPDIYAAGDAAQPVEEPGVPVRMSAFSANMMGAHVADSLSDALHGKEPQPFSFAYLAQAIKLGHQDAVFFVTYPDDKAALPFLTGGLAYRVRAIFVKLAFTLTRIERRPGLVFILGKGRYAAAKRLAERRLAKAR
jgi:NADH dehydrogenase FAD-containing subunit